MPYIMQHETWMTLTSLTGNVRGPALRSVDSALKNYHKRKDDESLRRLRLAMHHWKMRNGFGGPKNMPEWRANPRNRKKAIETLDLQLHGVPDAGAPSVLADLAELPFYGLEIWADADARDILRSARAQALTELFMGRQLTFKKAGLLSAAMSLRKKKEAVATNAAAAAKAAAKPALAAAEDEARSAVMGMIDSILGDYPREVAQEVLKLLGDMVPGLVADLVASMAHYISVAKSGAGFIKNVGQTVYSEYKWIVADNGLDAFEPGDPFAAAKALKRMLERERNHHARLATIYGAETAVKGVAIGLDAAAYGAPAVSGVITPLAGMGSAFARLTEQVFLMARDVNERRKANKILANPASIRLDPEVLDICPVLGCWFIGCANSSDIINFATEDMGKTGWMLDVEVLKRKHIDPTIGYARDLISDHRMEVSGLSMSKGAVAQTTGNIVTNTGLYKNRVVNKIQSKLPFTDYAQVNDMSGSVSKEVLKQRIAARP